MSIDGEGGSNGSQDADLDLDSDQFSVEALDEENDPFFDSREPPEADDSGTSEREFRKADAGETSGESSKLSSKRPGKQTNLSLYATFFKRKFVGETSGAKFASEIIYGNSVDEILQGIWSIVKPVIKQEVTFEDDNGLQVPCWANDEPTLGDLGKFVYLQNHANRRRVNVDKVDSKLLISWRSKEIRVHVHVYSTAVSCKQLWELVDRQLIRFQNSDRAGAPNNQSLTALANQLRDIHGAHFSGHASSWKIWANYLHSVPAHERERRMNDLPPHSIIKFFRSVPISEAVQLESARSGLSVARTINEAISTDLSTLESEVNELLTLGQRIKHRIQSLQTRCSTNSGIVTAMQDSIKPEEDEVSRSLAENVSDMNDVDHL